MVKPVNQFPETLISSTPVMCKKPSTCLLLTTINKMHTRAEMCHVMMPYMMLHPRLIHNDELCADKMLT